MADEITNALQSIDLDEFGAWPKEINLNVDESSLRIRVATGNLNQVASDLMLPDREIRRAALFVKTRDPDVSLSTSDHTQLEIASTGKGSLWIDVLTYGGVVSGVLLSDPVQLLAVTDWLVQRSRPLRRQNAELEMPPESERLSIPEVGSVLSDLAKQNPNRQIRAEISTSGVTIDMGAQRRWWTSGD